MAAVAYALADVRDFAGTYRFEDGFRLTFAIESGKFVLKLDGEPACELVTEDRRHFFCRDNNIDVVEFVRDVAGRVTHLLAMSSLDSFIIKGSIAVGAGPSKDYGHITIHARLPDAFVRSRVDTAVSTGGAAVAPTTTFLGHGSVSPAIYTFASRIGFVGLRLIYEPDVKPYQLKNLAPATEAEISGLYLRAQREFLPLVLGLFATPFAVSTVRYAEASGDEIEVVNPLRIPLTMKFDSQTGWPIRVGDLVFEDRREVAGVKVPFRLIRMLGSKAAETWDVKEFRIDVPIPPSVFR